MLIMTNLNLISVQSWTYLAVLTEQFKDLPGRKVHCRLRWRVDNEEFYTISLWTVTLRAPLARGS